MTEHTDHGDGHDRATHADGDRTRGRDGESEVTAWHLVPTAPPGTVPVEWRDLRAMRQRIDELETERDRLEARLEQSRVRRRRTVERYERLLDRRPGTETTRPRVRAADDAGTGRWRATESEASTPEVAPDGGFQKGPREETGDAPSAGVLSRLVAALAGLVSRG